MENFAEQIVTRLTEAQVEFIIVGGLSGVLHGASFITGDLDLCYRRTPSNITRLAQALAPLGPRLRGMPPDLPPTFDERTLLLGTNFTLEVGDEKLDLLGEMIAIGGYEQVVGRARQMEMAGCQVRVLCLEHLVKTKRAADRPKDRAVLPELQAMWEAEQEEKNRG